jgi:hypothetical protein
MPRQPFYAPRQQWRDDPEPVAGLHQAAQVNANCAAGWHGICPGKVYRWPPTDDGSTRLADCRCPVPDCGQGHDQNGT